MTDLFAPAPTDNLLPFDGIVNDFGIVIGTDNNVDAIRTGDAVGKSDAKQTIADSDKLYAQLLNELPWQSDKVTLFGKTHITRRQIVWMGDVREDNAFAYAYSGHTRSVSPWHTAVFHVKQLVEQKLAEIGVSTEFNTCLLNYYLSGEEGMGYHADDEPELGANPIIASLSLGATRKFVLKHKQNQHKVGLLLESGQLIVMRGATQQYWKHSVTKTKKVSEGRMSLTFRTMLS